MENTQHFQANAYAKVNGVEIKMMCDPFIKKIRVLVTLDNCTVDDDRYSYEDAADVSAAFAKFSNAVTWAVTREMSEPVTSGM